MAWWLLSVNLLLCLATVSELIGFCFSFSNVHSLSGDHILTLFHSSFGFESISRSSFRDHISNFFQRIAVSTEKNGGNFFDETKKY